MNTYHSLMVWPITEQGLTMTPGELIAEALDAICECNSRLDYPRLILMPSPAAFVIDRSTADRAYEELSLLANHFHHERDHDGFIRAHGAAVSAHTIALTLSSRLDEEKEGDD